MKNLILSIIICLFINSLYAQTVPQGMKYQAVARDLKGELIVNQQVSLKIQLQSNDQLSQIYYSENHVSTTNQFGLFSLIIGEGTIEQGDFSEIPWNTQDIWIKIAIKLNGEASYTTISNSKLLTVPYAFHAGTANALTTKKSSDLLLKDEGGISSQTWSLFGNLKTDPLKDKLGTSDAADLVFVTDNIERLRITADGRIITGPGKFTMGGNLEVQGDSARINKDLYVGRNVVLNFDNEFETKGETINNGNFTVANQSFTKLTGKLEVDGATLINDSLTVTGVTILDGLTVNTLKVKSDNANFVTEFENTNNGNGDGIKIKLGKRATKNSLVSKAADLALQTWLGKITPDDFSKITGILDGTLSTQDLAYLAELAIPTQDDALAIAATACQLTEIVGSKITDFLNQSLDLPITVGPLEAAGVTIMNRKTVFPSLPSVDLPCEYLGTGFSLPNIKVSDIYVSDPLNSENLFVEFTDNDDFSMGAIKAQSIKNWAEQYFDIVFLYDLYSTFKGLDKSKILPAVKVKGKEIAKSFLQIGVQYSSGNGDYAEWLERMDPNESIGAGDIVAVKAGKITKDLTNAEQVMTVSHRPIILGNIPKDGKNHLGNNVAFMGQIPVKIMGKVSTGDYIVGKGEIAGYGTAVRPEDMTIEDFKFAVGRAWESNENDGPKMVNTVIGVHNGDYINILKRYEQKFRESESRLESVEAKIDALTGIITANNKIN